MKKNKKCAVCDKKLKHVLSLGNHPCADTFLKNKKASISLRKYPLSVGFCGCNHLTAINHVSPFERYEKMIILIPQIIHLFRAIIFIKLQKKL